MLADEKTDSLPSNYGNWVNLTEGYTEDKTSNPQKMQVEIDGNTIHLLWVEFEKQEDDTYGIWYRRSTDLGKTWEDAKMIVKTHTGQV
jgi:Neuraminidase (sialidase)